MSALTSVRHKGSGSSRPFCSTPGCKAKHRAGDYGLKRTADEYLFLMGHPLGAYCKNCAKELKAAYASAHVCHDDGMALAA